MYSEQPSVYRIPNNTLKRIKARDSTLVEDLTLDDLVEIFNEFVRQVWMYGKFDDRLFISSVLIPEKTILAKNILSREEWESLKLPSSYYTEYVAGLLSYFDTRNDKEGIDMVKNLILKEKVRADGVLSFLRTRNPYILKFLIDIDPKIISGMFYHSEIRRDIPLLTDMLRYAKDKISKEYILEFFSNRLRISKIEDWEEGKYIIVMVESGIVEFTDLYYLIRQYNSPENIEWANRVIEAQI